MRTAGRGGAAAPRREPVAVEEPRPPERRLDGLLALRGHRVTRLEQERLKARSHWRTQRAALRAAIEGWRAADRRAGTEWEQARQAFFAMSCSSGQFRAARAAFERMQREAAILRGGACQAAAACRQAGRAYFGARASYRGAQRQQEKLQAVRAELLQGGEF